MPAGCSVSCPHYFKLWIRAGEEKCAHPQDSCYSTDNSTFSRRLPAPGVFRVFGSLMGLDLLLTSPTKRRIRMSGMLRGRRAANCTNRHCFHLALHLSVSALKDGLISSAPGLRFKHLSSSPPSLPPPLSASQCLPESLPFCLPLLQAWWGEDVVDCMQLGGSWMDGYHQGCTGDSTTSLLYILHSNPNHKLSNEVRQWSQMLCSPLPPRAASYGFISLFRPPAALKRS